MCKTVIAFGCLLLLAACATLTKGQNQTIGVNTPGVAGATCTLTSSSIGTRVVITPASVSLEKSKEAVAVRCTKECYLDGAGVIASNIQPMTAGNILVGGVIGLGVDAASGAMNEYQTDVQVQMGLDPACQKEEPVRRRR